MAETDIDSVSVGDQEGTETIYSVPTETTDGPSESNETKWCNEDWNKQLGYYKKIPELKAAIDAKARWTVGKGITSEAEDTEILLASLKGFGKDTFNTIIENLIRCMEIGGDSFAEIIRDDDGQLVNLKPLDPSTMQIVANRKGLILRYEKITKVGSKKQIDHKFEPDEILHFSRDRVADEIHGVSVVDAVEDNILRRNEAIQDYATLLRRNVKPVKFWEVDTDDPTEIAAFKTKADNASMGAENIIIPKGSVLPPTIVSVAPNATLNPLPWISLLTQSFYQEVGVPQIIVGGANEITEASAKIVYLAWEQTVEEYQMYIEEQILSQLNIEVELEFPNSLQNELLSDSSKSETLQASTPEDTAITNVGVDQ